MTMTRPRRRSPNRNRNRNLRQRQIHAQQRAGCPTPRKHGYCTQQEADTALAALWAQPRPGKDYPTRYYHCDCGNWHLTKAPAREYP